LALARGGAAVDLYLPGRPGEKPCGGAVPEHVLPRLAGFDPGSIPAVCSPRAVLENARGGRVTLPLTGLRIFRRRDFDAALAAAAQSAGAQILRRKVERLEPRGGAVWVAADGQRSAYAWAIGADGARGVARRSLSLPPRGDSVGLGASLGGLTWDRLVLAFPDAADAYLWIFPRPGGASVGIAWSAGRLSDASARAALDELLDRHLPAGWRDLPGPRYRYPIPVYGPWTAPAVRAGLSRRILLVGDAAAVADPLTREGIRYGLLTGQWAAESLLAGDPSSYLPRVTGELAAEMDRAARARELFFAGPVAQWMVPAARLHPGIRRVLGDLLAGRQGYAGLRRRLTKEIGDWRLEITRRTRSPSSP
jgi:flavin-dependent dehydrogenase